jgi:tRNA (guanine-N7-)-methyltransferase
MSFNLSHGRELSWEGFGYTSADLPPFDQGKLDPRRWFHHPERPFEMEIGSGKGTFLLQHAQTLPDINLLGIEWAGEFFRYAADRIRRHQIDSVRMLHADAVEFIRYWCDDSVTRVIHLYFSDPWPKSRHHKRRVIQDSTLKEFHRILQPQGQIRIVTDHDDLWAWCEDHARRNAHLFDRLPFERPASAPEGEVVGTNFERKYQREGRPFHAMILARRD